jgi:hypothetical protein
VPAAVEFAVTLGLPLLLGLAHALVHPAVDLDGVGHLLIITHGLGGGYGRMYSARSCW